MFERFEQSESAVDGRKVKFKWLFYDLAIHVIFHIISKLQERRKETGLSLGNMNSVSSLDQLFAFELLGR